MVAGELRALAVAAGGGAADVEALTDELYRRYFLRLRPPSRRRDRLTRAAHLHALSQANHGQGTWVPGWTWRRIDGDGRHEVEHRGVLYRARAEDVRVDAPIPGAACRVRVPKEQRRSLPGFYLALGDADEPLDPPYVLRLYWHLGSAAAVPWMERLTTDLNARGVSFRCKALVDPRDYRRADAAVLYLPPDRWSAARPVLEDLHRELRGDLRDAVPSLTRRLAPGLGLAEGEPGFASFGLDRCRLVAEAVAQRDAAEPAAAVAAAFRAAGLDPLHPHRSRGSSGVEVPFSVRRPRRRAPRSFLDAARRIGENLAVAALWRGERCTWLGTPRRARVAKRAGWATVAAPLPADLYDGTAGVGLFLAELAAVTGVAELRRVARGALTQALATLDPGEMPLGFYHGGLGVVWAVHRSATVLEEGALAERADELLGRLVGHDPPPDRLDVLSGRAGAVLALLDLHRATGAEAPRRLALELGTSLADQLAAGAVRRPLLGFSRGAAGMALALLELHAATAAPGYLDAARRVFAGEDAHFDAARGNWPDWRRGCDRPRWRVQWCHGAAGIVLARLRAARLDPERTATWTAAARRGLGTTRAGLEEKLTALDADTTLCHGAMGLIEILATASRVLGEPVWRAAAEDAACRLIERHGERGDWPPGVTPRGPQPSLLLGEAGIGLTLLRLAVGEGVCGVLCPGL